MTQPTSHLLDIYDCWLHLATDRSSLAVLRRKYGAKVLPKQEGGEFGGTIRFRVSPDDGPDVNHYVIHIDVKAHRGSTGDLLNTAAHEATHTAASILDSTATEYDGGSETLAWLVAWVTRWVWAEL